MVIDYVALKQKVLDAARDCARQGPGYAQQRPVLDAVAGAAGGNMWTRLDLDLQQAILTCWHAGRPEGFWAGRKLSQYRKNSNDWLPGLVVKSDGNCASIAGGLTSRPGMRSRAIN